MGDLTKNLRVGASRRETVDIFSILILVVLNCEILYSLRAVKYILMFYNMIR